MVAQGYSSALLEHCVGALIVQRGLLFNRNYFCAGLVHRKAGGLCWGGKTCRFLSSTTES